MSETTALSIRDADMVESAQVMDELRRIRTLCETARAVAQVLAAQLMESLWKIRNEVGDRKQFERLIAAHTDLEPGRSWLMAETWEAGRQNRELRQLASAKPNEALALITQFVEGGLEDRLEGLSDEDQEIAAIIAKAPRKRTAAIRDLIAQSKTAQTGKRNPADAEEIAVLTAERDAAIEQLEAARKVVPHAGEKAREVVDDLRKAEKAIADIAHRITLLPHDSARNVIGAEAVPLFDLIIQSAERAGDILLNDPD